MNKNDLKAKLIELDERVLKIYMEKMKEILVPSMEEINALLNEIKSIREEAYKLRANVKEEDVENSVWVNHIIELMDCWEVGIKEGMRQPSRYLRGIGFRIFKVIEDEKKGLREKSEEIKNISTKVAKLLPAVHEICLKVDDDRVKRALKCLEGLKRDLEKYSKILEEMRVKVEEEEKWKGEIVNELKNIGNTIEEYIPKIRGIIGTNRELIEDIPYEELMMKHYGIPIKWVMGWYIEELEKAKWKFKELARKIDPNKEPLQVLRERIHVPYNTPEEMFKAMEEFLEIAKKNAKEYIEFPDEVTCKVIGLKEFEKDVYPMGHAGGPDPLEGGLESYVALNQYNYKAFSRGWLMMMAIHEAYYGHNIHSIKVGLANIPKTFKIGSGIATPISEGLAHRGEELLQHIYGDEAFPLLVAWRRVQTTLRIYIDIGLFHTKTLTPEDAVKLYMDVMGFDEQTSRGLVEWHLENRGYNVCYFTGYKMIEELRKHTNISEKEFSNTLFSAGFISINNAKRLLKIKEKMPWEKW